MSGRFAVQLSMQSISVAIAAVLLSSCGGLSPEPAPQSPTQASSALAAAASFSPDAQHYGDDAWIYTAQLYGDDVSIYKRSGSKLKWFETWTSDLSAPQGTVTTVDGWWYVANGGDSNVLIYRSSKKGPSGPLGQPLDDYGQNPVNVDVSPNRRLVAVSNYGSASQAGNVSVYLDRATEPSRKLTYGSDVVQGAGVAIDHQGNCFWSFNDPGTGSGSIVEFARCAGTGSVVVSGIPKAGGIAFDQSGDLYYVNGTSVVSNPSGVYECAKTSDCHGFATGIFGLPTNMNFDYKDKDLWVADATGYIFSISSSSPSQYTKYPAIGGATDPPVGIAPSPGGD